MERTLHTIPPISLQKEATHTKTNINIKMGGGYQNKIILYALFCNLLLSLKQIS